MVRPGSAGKVTARPFQPDDEDSVLELLQVAFGQWPRDIDDVTPSEFFRWKHLQGPFGRSVLVVAEADDAVVGFIAYLPWRFRAGERIVTAMRGVDFAVHPAYQRRGPRWRCAQRPSSQRCPHSLRAIRSEQSRPGGARSGPSPVEKLPRYVQAQKPLRTAVALGMGRAGPEQISVGAKTAAEVLVDDSQASLLAVRPRAANGRLATVKDLAYLRWRYGRFAEYRAIRSHAHSARGMVIFRVLRRKQFAVTQVCELFVEEGDRRAIGDVLQAVKKAAPTDFLTCSFPSAHDAAVRGFLPFHGKSVLMVYPLQPTMEPDPAPP